MRLVFIVFTISVLSAGACLAQLSPCDGLSQGVRTGKPVYDLGEPLTFQYAIRNDTSSPAVLTFPSGKQFDIWVTQGDGDLFRASKGRVYTQAQTRLVLQPGETKTFCAQWNQMDMNTGKQVGPGAYMVYAQLTTEKTQPPVTSARFQIGMASAAMVPITICEAISYAAQSVGRKVMIVATYRGAGPDPNVPNTKSGPPVTPNDWVICDATGCMYVTGAITLYPVKDIGTTMTVVGRIAKTDSGQVYLILLSATTAQGNVCPT